MASKTKIVLITSDEDLIRQFCLNKDKQTTSNEYDFDFLTEFFGLNSKNDDMYKRALDAPQQNQSKPVKIRKKISEDMLCFICGDKAIGFNYNVISCAACKVFFRRYANSDKFKCITGENQCLIAYNMRRKCQRCRLDRCFAMGMRKDFIRSEEEKQRRKKIINDNRNLLFHGSSESSNLHSEGLSETLDEIDRFLMEIDQNIDINRIEETLFVGDLEAIETKRLSFLSTFQNSQASSFRVDLSNRASALISWSHIVNQIILSFIRFFRLIDEFENLHLDDRFILIKYNFVSMYPIFRCFHYKSINNCCSCDENEEAIKHRRFFRLCGDTNGVRDVFINLVVSLVDVSEQDPTLLSLLLSILIFSPCLSMSEDGAFLKDSLAVSRAQCHYAKLLWIYLINKRGEMQACKQFIRLVTVITHLQLTSKRIRDFFRIPMMALDAVDRIAPLMQSVLHVS